MKKLVAILLACSLLCGCGNYHELIEYDMVLGMAVDYDKYLDEYTLTFELLDMANADPASSAQSTIIKSRGKGIQNAVLAAYRVTKKKMNFGNMEIIIFPVYLLQDKDFSEVLSWFEREAQIRETAQILISGESSAGSLFYSKQSPDSVISFTMREMLMRDRKSYNPKTNVTLYQVLNILSRKGQNLVAPMMYLTHDENGEVYIKRDGLAAFKNERIVGFVDYMDTMYYQFAAGSNLEDELWTTVPGYTGAASAMVKYNSTKTTFNFDGDTFTFHLDIKADTHLLEAPAGMSFVDPDQRERIEVLLEATLIEEVDRICEYIQKKLGTDILGFGELVYISEPKLWEYVEEDWGRYFKEAKVEINAEIAILATGNIDEG